MSQTAPRSRRLLDLRSSHIALIVSGLCEMAYRHQRSSQYIFDQCFSLELNDDRLQQLVVLCGSDTSRVFKVLLAYEYGLVTRQNLLDDINDKNDSAFHSLAFLVDEKLRADDVEIVQLCGLGE